MCSIPCSNTYHDFTTFGVDEMIWNIALHKKIKFSIKDVFNICD